MTAFDDLLEANDRFVSRFTAGALPAPPARGLAVLTCMDARILPLAVFGLESGDAHIIRNAGGRVTDDTFRSLLVSTHVMDVRAIAVIHHTECGMARFTDQELKALTGADHLDFRVIANPEASLKEDVAILSESPLFPDGTEIHGFEYDVRTGRLRPVI